MYPKLIKVAGDLDHPKFQKQNGFCSSNQGRIKGAYEPNISLIDCLELPQKNIIYNRE
ncbi:hypothetical protein HYC85_023470 [Camellia sinensis]|uniref:Uncharacterized protein n=1 Tax=Camellia sinensis TaxID=4442 RepID=A0A7J7GH32_CAMSI|nr:hypothetical protein HYC85_023470 [Camellia sinensis]